MSHGTVILSVPLLLIAATGCITARNTHTYQTVPVVAERSRQDAQGFNAEGLAYVAKGDHDRAERAFREALAADPGFAAAHNNLGLALLKTRSSPYEAAIQYALAGKLAPHAPEPRINLADLFERLGWDAEAVAEYERALAIDHNNSEAMGRLAYLYTRMGKEQAVVAPLLRVLAGNEGDEDWRRWALAELGEPRQTASQRTVGNGADASR